MKKKIITVITGSRPDYAALKQVLKLINLKKNLILRLVVTGSHLFSGNKNLLKFIFKDGFKIHKKIINLFCKNHIHEVVETQKQAMLPNKQKVRYQMQRMNS